MSIFSKIIGSSDKENISVFLKKEAIILDVRTEAEYVEAHADGSINIPLNEIETRHREISKMNKPVLLCCRSGARSAQATRFLKNRGITCENGGSWEDVQAMIKA